MEEAWYWAALQRVPDLGHRALLRLYQSFPSGKEAWEAEAGLLSTACGIPPAVAEKIAAFRRGCRPEQVGEELERKQVKVVLLNDPAYPPLLRHIPDPPVVLYYQGRLPGEEQPLLAVVGARRATPYGLGVARALSRELARRGWGIVSGFARGIDTEAHLGALAEDGYTVAVLGCGLDVCYPRENRRLMDEIRARGCLLSEFPPGTPPLASNFPVRNRIISGCTLGTLVVEAGEKSGSLITARLALEQGREVFAVPGAITSPQSRGTNALIKEGAKLVMEVTDIIEEFPYLAGDREAGEEAGAEPLLSPAEAAVYRLLTTAALPVDELAEAAGMEVGEVSAILTLLELKGLVRRLPGNCFARLEARLP